MTTAHCCKTDKTHPFVYHGLWALLSTIHANANLAFTYECNRECKNSIHRTLNPNSFKDFSEFFIFIANLVGECVFNNKN